MNFLIEYDVSKETIEKIKENYDESTCFYCLTIKENMKEVINYLKSIHVESIDQLLTNRLELFFLPVETLKEHLREYNEDVFVQLLNEDINVLNNI